MGWGHSSGLIPELVCLLKVSMAHNTFHMASRGRVQEHKCGCVTHLLRKLLMFLKTTLWERKGMRLKKKRLAYWPQVVKLIGCYGCETRQGFLLETASDTELEGRQDHWGKLGLILQRPGQPNKSKGQKQPAEMSWGLRKRKTKTVEHQYIRQG